MENKTAFLLDADETVLDFIRSSKESFLSAMCTAGLSAIEGEYALFKRINDGLWREYERGEVSKARLVVERFARLFEQTGVSADPASVNRIYFTTLSRTGYLLPGADEFLTALSACGKVFLVTNGTPAAQYGRLDALGIRGRFDGIFVSDEIGYAKPDRRFYEYVFSRTGLCAEDCLVIGDSLSSDIRGANNAGIESIWYAPNGGKPEGAVPDHIARSYTDILSVVKDRIKR